MGHALARVRVATLACPARACCAFGSRVLARCVLARCVLRALVRSACWLRAVDARFCLPAHLMTARGLRSERCVLRGVCVPNAACRAACWRGLRLRAGAACWGACWRPLRIKTCVPGLRAGFAFRTLRWRAGVLGLLRSGSTPRQLDVRPVSLQASFWRFLVLRH